MINTYERNVDGDKVKVFIAIDGFSPKLALKDGETIKEPQKTEKELRMEKLRKELEELENAE